MCFCILSLIFVLCFGSELFVFPFRINKSTWGISCSVDKPILAVSANTFEITVFNLDCDNLWGNRKVLKVVLFVFFLGFVLENYCCGFVLFYYFGRDMFWQICSYSCAGVQGHEHNIPCIDVSPDSNWIASVSIDGTARIWNLNNVKLFKESELGEW